VHVNADDAGEDYYVSSFCLLMVVEHTVVSEISQVAKLHFH